MHRKTRHWRFDQFVFVMDTDPTFYVFFLVAKPVAGNYRMCHHLESNRTSKEVDVVYCTRMTLYVQLAAAMGADTSELFGCVQLG